VLLFGEKIYIAMHGFKNIYQGAFLVNEFWRKLFLKLRDIMNWLLSSIAVWIWTMIFILVFLLIYVSSSFNFNDRLQNIILGLFSILILYPFVALNLKTYMFKLPFICQKTDSPAQLFDIFSHRSFFYGIIVYSFFTSIIIVLLISAIGSWFNYKIDSSNWYSNLFFITSALFTIIYFMYHMSVKNISTKEIKARLRLYSAIVGTISGGLLGLSIKEILVPLITYLGIAFLWLSFCVEQVEVDKEKKERKQQLL